MQSDFFTEREDQANIKMPLYHVHVAKEQRKVDYKVIDLPNAESAKHHAARLAHGLAVLSHGFRGARLRDWCVQVTDEKGKAVARWGLAHSSPGQSDVQRRLRA